MSGVIMGLAVALFYWKPVLSFVTGDVGRGFMAGGEFKGMCLLQGEMFTCYGPSMLPLVSSR